MKRRYLLGGAVSALAVLALPATALAQFPPDPPATFYGNATGATSSQGVIAIVLNGSVSTVCGTGSVQNDAGGPVYVVDVVSDAQRPGCGKPGRTVQFYFTPFGGTNGRLAVETGTWPASAGPKAQNLTLGAPLTEKRIAVHVAKDGVN